MLKPKIKSIYAVEAEMYQSRPDIWAISKALKHCPDYRAALQEMLSQEDREALADYGKRLTGK